MPTLIEAGRDPAAEAPAADRMLGLCVPTKVRHQACGVNWCAPHLNGTAGVEADPARLDERRVSDADPAHCRAVPVPVGASRQIVSEQWEHDSLRQEDDGSTTFSCSSSLMRAWCVFVRQR